MVEMLVVYVLRSAKFATTRSCRFSFPKCKLSLDCWDLFDFVSSMEAWQSHNPLLLVSFSSHYWLAYFICQTTPKVNGASTSGSAMSRDLWWTSHFSWCHQCRSTPSNYCFQMPWYLHCQSKTLAMPTSQLAKSSNSIIAIPTHAIKGWRNGSSLYIDLMFE